MRAKSFGLLAAASVTSMMFGAAAQAQTNPFIPQSAASRAEIERVVDQKLKEAEERILSQVKSAAGAPTGDGAPGAPVPGGAVAPGAPEAPGAPGAPGPLNPAGPNYPPVSGVPGDPSAAPMTPPGGAVEQSRARFLGCINGTHKFTSARGRVTFTQAEINRAIKDGVLPPCR